MVLSSVSILQLYTPHFICRLHSLSLGFITSIMVSSGVVFLVVRVTFIFCVLSLLNRQKLQVLPFDFSDMLLLAAGFLLKSCSMSMGAFKIVALKRVNLVNQPINL
jgi:hypothetical protein